MAEPQIVGIGGGGDTPEQTRTLLRHVLSLTGKERPRVRPRADGDGDAPEGIVWGYERLGRLCDLSHVRFFPYPPEDLRELVLAQDAIYVGGGNVANMLAIWRVHGFGEILREAWERGVVLFGVSAGMLCWFEAGVHGLVRAPARGAARRARLPRGQRVPALRRRGAAAGRATASSSTAGFPEGIAADDGVGLHYVGTELREIVTCRPGATAYRVTRDGEERLDAREPDGLTALYSVSWKRNSAVPSPPSSRRL